MRPIDQSSILVNVDGTPCRPIISLARDQVLRFTLYSALTRAAIDVTGATITGTLRTRPGDTATLLQKTLGLATPASGLVTLTVTKTELAAFTLDAGLLEGVAWLDLNVSLAGLDRAVYDDAGNAAFPCRLVRSIK